MYADRLMNTYIQLAPAQRLTHRNNALISRKPFSRHSHGTHHISTPANTGIDPDYGHREPLMAAVWPTRSPDVAVTAQAQDLYAGIAAKRHKPSERTASVQAEAELNQARKGWLEDSVIRHPMIPNG